MRRFCVVVAVLLSVTGAATAQPAKEQIERIIGNFVVTNVQLNEQLARAQQELTLVKQELEQTKRDLDALKKQSVPAKEGE